MLGLCYAAPESKAGECIVKARGGAVLPLVFFHRCGSSAGLDRSLERSLGTKGTNLWSLQAKDTVTSTFRVEPGESPDGKVLEPFILEEKCHHLVVHQPQMR
jgi:hypothetical protein